MRRIGTQGERRVGAGPSNSCSPICWSCEPDCNVRRSLSPTRLIRFLCSECGRNQGIYVPAEGFSNWKLGFGTVQELMPELTTDERAALWSGRCLRCVRLMYENMETEGDESGEGYERDPDPRTVTDIRSGATGPSKADQEVGAVPGPNSSQSAADANLAADAGHPAGSWLGGAR